jgi:hypothetical protein
LVIFYYYINLIGEYPIFVQPEQYLLTEEEFVETAGKDEAAIMIKNEDELEVMEEAKEKSSHIGSIKTTSTVESNLNSLKS